MGFFFAWVGDLPIPAITITASGDVWGGSIVLLGSTWGGELKTTGDILTTGVWEEKGPKISNLRDVSGLVSGNEYLISGPGIATNLGGGVSGSAPIGVTINGITTYYSSFIFDGEDGGTVSPSAELGENVAVTIKSTDGTDIVHLDDPTGLVNGTTYGISGPGIPQDTFFTYTGGSDITITNPATATGSEIELTITLDIGRDLITNLAGDSLGLLEVGEIYQVFGAGVPAAALGIYQSDGTLLLSQDATTTGYQTFLRIHRGIIYPDGGAFDASVHARNDETVLSVVIEHSEGNFPLLTIDLKNPRIGLLAPLRNVWCWLSWQKTIEDPIIALFHGRLVAIPANVEGEKVSLKFIAQPADYDNQRALLAETLKVSPYYDPIWLANGVSTPETILEARTASWHTDRTTLGVSISDMTTGEDGTLEVAESEHLYADMNVKFGNPPLAGVYLTGSVTRSQEGSGDVDLTGSICKAFKDAGSGYGTATISSYCGDGLFSSWPQPEANIGAGWKVGLDSYIQKATWLKPLAAESTFASSWDPYLPDGATITPANPWADWTATFPLNAFAIKFIASYVAKRDWVETVSFFLEADIQEIITDSRANTESFSLSSALVNDPIDQGGLMPLRDLRYNSYFQTARGEDSVKFLLAYARAKLVWRARAVSIEFTVPWEKAVNAGLSCRWNGHLSDARLPGGEATGKVIAYELTANATGGQRAKITIGCSVGRGGSVAAVEGVGSYAAAAGYMAPGYQAMLGGTVDLGDNSVTFSALSNFTVIDDGVNLFDMSPQNVIKSLKVINGPTAQLAAIAMIKRSIDGTGDTITKSTVKPSIPPVPADALKAAYTVVSLQLKPVTGGAFLSEFAIDVSKLQIPKTIDLEAPSNA